ncbi:unknown [Phocaeicola coprophilus CAG:333]|nr:unknown [Phocaeicola coprophilus CAG:333]
MFLKLNLFVISYDTKVKRLMYLLCYQQVIFRLRLRGLSVPAIIIFPKMKMNDHHREMYLHILCPL